MREVIPLQAAIDLEADKIFAIHAASQTLKPFQTPSQAGVLDIVSRSLTEIAIDEIDFNDRYITPKSNPKLPFPSIVHIEPEENLHDITVIDPGLIRIYRDYGYMKAADAFDAPPVSDERKRLSTEITMLRRDIWRMENRKVGQPDPTEPFQLVLAPDPTLKATIKQMRMNWPS